MAQPARNHNALQRPAEDSLELSVVIPCLNEADTIGICVKKAVETLEGEGIQGEVIVADNGSTDGSQAIAEGLGARVVPIPDRGYGAALMGGIRAARGRFLIMGDADDSYDFREIPKYLAELRKGASLVQGCRLPSGGGQLKPGAMPFLHRWVGNPILSLLARVMFRTPVHDIYCGMRGFTREMYDRLELRCTGMEFATEMIIKSSVWKEKIAEIPTTLYQDGRKAHPPHLRTFRDGWRTLRLFLLLSPRWVFIVPGLGLGLFGATLYLAALFAVRVGPATLDLNTLCVAMLCLLISQQAIMFAIATRTLAVRDKLLPPDALLSRFFRHATLERGLMLGATLAVVGTALVGRVAYVWFSSDFPPLDYPSYMRWTFSGALLCALGMQTIFSSLFISMLGTQRK